MKKPVPLLLCVLMVPALLSGCVFEQAATPSSPAVTENPAPTPTPEPVSYTTGLPGNTDYAPVAVSIDNASGARPQSGLQDADIVYELEAEGRIPRFIAIFNDKIPEEVGPVRSARVYFLDIIQEYDSMLVHVGGPKGRGNASDVYVKFDTLGIEHIDGDGEYIWRNYKRKAPFNCYTDIEKDRAAYTYQPSPHTFLYSDGGLQTEATGISLSVPYFAAENKAVYKYDQELGEYLRFNNSKPLTDANTGEQVKVKNVVVQFAEHSMIDEKHIDVELYGTGEAWILSGGKCVRGTWERKDSASPTVFYDADGNRVALQPGNTWINVVRTDLEVTVE